MNRKALILVFVFAFISWVGFVSADQQQPSLERRAEKRTEVMKASLNLNEEQVIKIDSINLSAAHKMQELKDNNSKYKRIIFRKIQLVRKERDVELQKVLTNEQWHTYQAKKEELRSEVQLQMKQIGEQK
jgi:hypothetical protein